MYVGHPCGAEKPVGIQEGNKGTTWVPYKNGSPRAAVLLRTYTGAGQGLGLLLAHPQYFHGVGATQLVGITIGCNHQVAIIEHALALEDIDSTQVIFVIR